MRRSTLLLVLTILIGWGSWAAAREWKSQSGKFSIDAEFVELTTIKTTVDDEEVVVKAVKLRKPDGKHLTVPVDKLSKADRDFLEDLKKQPDPKEEEKNRIRQEKREEAGELIEQAFVLFKQDPRKNAKLVKKKLEQAAKLDPGSIQADFVRGIMNTMVATNFKVAEKNFEACLKRIPDHPSSLNNLALVYAKAQDFKSAITTWKRLVKVAPEIPYVAHNIGRLLEAEKDGKVKIPSAQRDALAELFAEVSADDTSLLHNPKVGYVMLVISERDTSEASPDSSSVPKNIAGGGTGFVVKGDYIVTNKHVIDEADGLKVMLPGREGLMEAKVVAISNTHDVAVIKCDGMKLPSVGLTGSVARPGTDLMVLGYPHFFQLGATLKTTRGTVTSKPSNATDGMMLVDAKINSGNSGGPIVDQHGHVIAIATAVYNAAGGTEGKYGAGIPIPSVRAFLSQHIPGLPPSASSSTNIDWPDVSEKVGASTVLILAEKNAGGKSGSRGGQVNLDEDVLAIQDPSCTACGGTKVLKQGFKSLNCGHCLATGFDLGLLGIKVERRRN